MTRLILSIDSVGFADPGVQDTDFNVQAYCGGESENVNALESIGKIPEPATVGLVGLGRAGLVTKRRRRRRA